MPQEVRCPACEGALGWSGAQLSCRACGKVYTIEGKPGSKVGVLIVGLGIGCILGFILAYELIRFVPSIQPSTQSAVTDSVEQKSSPAPVTEDVQPEVRVDELSYFIEPDEYASIVMGEPIEAVKSGILAENSRPDVVFELHSTRVSGDMTWIYGATTNRSPRTVESVTAFAIRKDQAGKVLFQDDFYASHSCVAPGQTTWTIGLIETTDAEGLNFELYPEAARHCRRPVQGVDVEYDVRQEGDRWTVYGSVTNNGKWGVKFAQVHAYQLSNATDRKLVGHNSGYLQGILRPGSSQRFTLGLYGGDSELFEVAVTGSPTNE